MVKVRSGKNLMQYNISDFSVILKKGYKYCKVLDFEDIKSKKQSENTPYDAIIEKRVISRVKFLYDMFGLSKYNNLISIRFSSCLSTLKIKEYFFSRDQFSFGSFKNLKVCSIDSQHLESWKLLARGRNLTETNIVISVGATKNYLSKFVARIFSYIHQNTLLKKIEFSFKTFHESILSHMSNYCAKNNMQKFNQVIWKLSPNLIYPFEINLLSPRSWNHPIKFYENLTSLHFSTSLKGYLDVLVNYFSNHFGKLETLCLYPLDLNSVVVRSLKNLGNLKTIKNLQMNFQQPCYNGFEINNMLNSITFPHFLENLEIKFSTLFLELQVTSLNILPSLDLKNLLNLKIEVKLFENSLQEREFEEFANIFVKNSNRLNKFELSYSNFSESIFPSKNKYSISLKEVLKCFSSSFGNLDILKLKSQNIHIDDSSINDFKIRLKEFEVITSDTSNIKGIRELSNKILERREDLNLRIIDYSIQDKLVEMN